MLRVKIFTEHTLSAATDFVHSCFLGLHFLNAGLSPHLAHLATDKTVLIQYMWYTPVLDDTVALWLAQPMVL